MRKLTRKLFKEMGWWVFTWLLLWFIIFALRIKGFDYTTHPVIISFAFLFSSIIVFSIFFRHYFVFKTKFNWIPFAVLAVSILVAFSGFYLISNNYEIPQTLLDISKLDSFFDMSYEYLFAKLFDILFQQTLIVLLAAFLVENKAGIRKSIFFFVILFFIVHLPVLFTWNSMVGLYYLTASVAAGIIFPLLIEKLKYGYIYSYIIHYGFYVISGFLIWIIF
ncbi:MAG: hypothetical protein KJ718_02295 [Nanoarchaeota archaeon]|nr:hypothetical protein [Nanoarchaeota archaeon]MBU1051363.1 hypothetical protein [Nanoarchaeota archaeon]MBU1988378.1 hypothetical protein [Nanoarchaeota archaeon]